MNYENNDLMVVQETQSELLGLDYDNILQVAERADKMVTAMNKIMNAAIRITTERDWCLIGGTPYLQESGATKVARLFGISWQILDQKTEYDSEGYPTYTYRMAFTMGGSRIECDGSRSAKDEFFAGKNGSRSAKDEFFAGKNGRRKTPDEVDVRDVKQAAYTNCLNNGIKRILPGLRNLDVSALEAAGLDGRKLKGYTFKEGSKGGTDRGRASDSGIVCDECGTPITQKVASYSQGKYGRALCMKCQKSGGVSAPAPEEEDRPPLDDCDAPPERG